MNLETNASTKSISWRRVHVGTTLLSPDANREFNDGMERELDDMPFLVTGRYKKRSRQVSDYLHIQLHLEREHWFTLGASEGS